MSAIALTTSKEVMSQPLFYIVLALGVCALLAFIVMPYNTFGDDVKMMKDSGLTVIMLLAILLAVWSASVSIADELEGRTALTLLSKPIRRRQFILGKFLGILEPALLLFILLGFAFLVSVSYKVVYDAREVALPEPTWQACYAEIVKILPGLVLAFLETVVLAAISVALSTRLPMVANLVVCSAIYVLGHLVPPAGGIVGRQILAIVQLRGHVSGHRLAGAGPFQHPGRRGSRSRRARRVFGSGIAVLRALLHHCHAGRPGAVRRPRPGITAGAPIRIASKVEGPQRAAGSAGFAARPGEARLFGSGPGAGPVRASQNRRKRL